MGLFNHTVQSEPVVIEADADTVMRVLCDFENYPAWNPFTPQVEATLAVGEPIVLHVRWDNGKELRQVETICATGENGRLAWGTTMGAPWLLRARRDQTVRALDSARCEYHTTDALSGWLTPLVIALYGRKMQNGFNAMASALKAYVENRLQ